MNGSSKKQLPLHPVVGIIIRHDDEPTSSPPTRATRTNLSNRDPRQNYAVSAPRGRGGVGGGKERVGGRQRTISCTWAGKEHILRAPGAA